MRVLLISHYFLPYSVGGTEEYAFLLARELVRRGHTAHVFHGILDDPELGEEELREHEYEGVPCTGVSADLCSIDDFSGTWRRAAVDRAFARFLAGRVFDLAHVQHLTRLSLGIVEQLRARGIPVLITLHDYWMQCALGQRVQRDGSVCQEVELERCARCMAEDVDFLDRRKPAFGRLRLLGRAGTRARHLRKIRERRAEMLSVLDAADGVVTASRYVRESFRTFGVEIKLALYGVDHALRNGDGGSPAESLRFGFLGRLAPTKGLDVLSEAFVRVRGNARLVLHGAGEPDEERRARELAAADPRVSFEGGFARDELATIYAGFDVQIVPSTWFECSPLVLQYAYLFRTPLVVSAVGALQEVASTTGGVVAFRPGDPADLAARLQELVDQPERVAELRAALPPPRPLEEHIDELLSIYEEVREPAP